MRIDSGGRDNTDPKLRHQGFGCQWKRVVGPNQVLETSKRRNRKVMTAVEYIEKGILARERHWHDQYQQGYQRALSDVMLLVDDAKQMEKDQLNKACYDGYYREDLYDTRKYYDDTYKK